MNRHTAPALLTLAGLAGVALLTGCTSLTTSAEPEHAAAPHWSYEGEDGPDHWADLSGDNETCGGGTAQSPVDLAATTPAEGGPSFTIRSDAAESTSADNGHTVQITPGTTASTIDFEGDDYALLQTHFHVPAEHTVSGERADAEFHFVHSDDDGNLVVLGLLANAGEADADWDAYIDAVDNEGEDVTLDVSSLLPAGLDAYAYEGSLTTPPCTEGVQWLVLAEPVELGAEQLKVLADAHGHTARPLQPLGDRNVHRGAGTLVAD
nr:carbonic anhydrase family protein [uncultured Microbacterium sp.]